MELFNTQATVQETNNGWQVLDKDGKWVADFTGFFAAKGKAEESNNESTR